MSKSTPLPGYKTTKPAIPAIKSMFRELGAQDACIQLQELCAVYMQNSAAATNAPLDAFLHLLYQGNGIPHGTLSFSELRQLSAKSYIVLTYALFEKMLLEVIDYVKSSIPGSAAAWVTKSATGGRLPPLLELAANLPAAERQSLEGVPEFRLFEHYRAVRVANSHVVGNTANKAQVAFGLLSNNDLSHFTHCYELQAPNPASDITFQDFRLFTRAIKYYSRLVNEAARSAA
jgi:hypothetical protein